ncbi:MAG: hypothetical protein H6577_05930 [Lewinellaceae bacterium]|nr:hypothetical protein [Saprospiraceae bacterium]MCB9337646.1 hypothetical protein [Lewinellaceae bacterium]
MPGRLPYRPFYTILLRWLAALASAYPQPALGHLTVEDSFSQGYVSPIWAVPAPAPIPKPPAQGKVTSTCHPS